jgi:hypothetical protein
VASSELNFYGSCGVEKMERERERERERESDREVEKMK